MSRFQVVSPPGEGSEKSKDAEEIADRSSPESAEEIKGAQDLPGGAGKREVLRADSTRRQEGRHVSAAGRMSDRD